MTCLEKYRALYPEEAGRSDENVVCYDCPSSYGIMSDTFVDCFSVSCESCWNRTVPEASTNFERIKCMSLDEMAESAVKPTSISIPDGFYRSLLDATIHPSKELAIAYNKKWLEQEGEGNDQT